MGSALSKSVEVALKACKEGRFIEAYAGVYGERWGWGLDQSRIPQRMFGGIVRYMVFGVTPGGFLVEVLSNNLMGALTRADEENYVSLHLYGSFLHNYADTNSFGSIEAVKTWVGKGGCLGNPEQEPAS